MVHLFDVVPEEDYETSLANGYISVRRSAQYPYLLHNYTRSCTYDQAWTTATKTCRGLITHAETREVLARPLPKFFNYGEPDAPTIALSAPVEVTEKLDGSLGVLYPTPDGRHAIATRGSFGSAQARWATEFWQDHYEGLWKPKRDYTYLFEIIYPDNRIVLKYDFSNLVLIGVIDIATGLTVPLNKAGRKYPGPHAEVHPLTSLTEVLAVGERPDREGFVVRDLISDQRIKIKHSEYVRLHGLLTNTTQTTVWEALRHGDDLSSLFDNVPDEYLQAVNATAAGMRERFESLEVKLLEEFDSIVMDLNAEYGSPEDWGRSEFAAKAKTSPHASVMFSLLDGKGIDEWIWREIKPEPIPLPNPFDEQIIEKEKL